MAARKKKNPMRNKTFRMAKKLSDEVKAVAAKHGMSESIFMRWAVAHTTRVVRDGLLVPPPMRPDFDSEAA